MADETQQEQEEWTAAAGWPEYEVSDLGRVRNVRPWRGGGGITERILSQHRNYPGGYLRVALSRAGVRRYVRVHRLVLESFVGPPPPAHECCHLDGDKGNNRLDNLEWGTHLKNMRHAVIAGAYRRGEESPSRKLTEDMVIAIRKEYRRGDGNRLAKKYGVKSGAIYRVLYGHTWEHIPE